MTQLFDRKIRVTAVPDSGPSRQWDESLRLDFNVTQTIDREPNTASIQIYNLSNASRAWLKSHAKNVILEAGYGNLTGTLFAGDISRIWTDRSNPPDIVTKMECSDGLDAFTNQTISITLGPGTPVSSVMRELQTALGLPLRFIDGDLDQTAALLNGITMHGPVVNYLDDIADRLDATWSVQDGALQFVTDGGNAPMQAILVTADTGLIGSPSEMTKKSRRGTPDIVGLEWDMLLQHTARPGQLFQLNTRDFNGYYTGQKLQHQGSNFGGEFLTHTEATERATV